MRIALAVLVVAACGGSPKQPEPAKPISNEAVPAKEEDPQLARQQAIEAARSAGVLGSIAVCDPSVGGAAYGGSTYGCAFASLTGTGDISSGFDDTNIYGGLLGNEAGEISGAANGSGDGGTAVGTMGTGRYGTIGHGSGTGSGYGSGSGRGGMRGKTSPVPSVRIGQPAADSGLDKAIIRRYIKRNIQKITYCYEKRLLDDPSLAGKVTLKFTIEPDGKVSSSTASGLHADVETCIAALISQIEFPKPKGGGKINVSYPFTFKPTGG